MTETLAQQWLAAMLGVSIQFTVLVAIVAAALFVLRPLAPRVRYVVWLLVLARLAIPVAVTSPWGTVPSSLAQLRVVEAPPGDRLVAGERLETSAPPEGAATAGAAGTTMRPGAGATVSPAGMLFLAWGIGVLGLVTVQVVRSARRRARMGAAIEPLPPEVDRRIDQLRTELGLRRAVDARVVRDDAIGGPLIQGWLRPRVLLPSSLVQSWRREALDAVLLHELIHLRRLDPAARALGNLLQIAYFFHPLAWWVGRRLAEEREQACDDAVVRRLRGDKRIYMKSLLRLVEERAVVAWGAPGLRMAAARRPLARRLRRMLRPRYNPSPRVPAFALGALVLSVGLGCALSTGAPVPPPAALDEPVQIYTTVVRLGAFFAESVEQVEQADRVELGRDFTIGRRLNAVKPEAETLAAGSPALFERLEVLRHLTVNFLVDRAGAVHRVRFAGDVDEDLRRPFLEVLRTARFDPTTHGDRGPAIVEVQVDYHINPELPRQSLYERGQALAGDEVAEVAPRGGQDGLARGGLPRYAAVLEKGEPPVLDVGDEELILAFILAIDDRGNVGSATLFRDSRDGPYQAVAESTAESERLAAYLETFRFEPIVLSDGAPARATAMIDLRVSARGVEVATRAGDREELERRLAEVYRLPDGRNLDLRPPPHPPERMILYRTGHPVQARGIPWGPDMMTIVWVGDRPTFRGASFGPMDLLSLMTTLGVRRGAVRFEGGAENVRIAADVVRRDGASEEELLGDLPQVLKERLDHDLSFRVVSEPSRTLVLSGSIGAVPPDDEQDGARVLHVFTDRRDPRSGSGGQVADAGGLVAMLSGHLDMPVVDATTGAAAEPFRVRLHGSAYETDLLDLLMQNLESQTDLDIAVEERLDRIVVVSPS